MFKNVAQVQIQPTVGVKRVNDFYGLQRLAAEREEVAIVTAQRRQPNLIHQGVECRRTQFPCGFRQPGLSFRVR